MEREAANIQGNEPRWEVLTRAVMVKPTIKGKYRDALPSSKEFIQQKQREIDLSEGFPGEGE